MILAGFRVATPDSDSVSSDHLLDLLDASGSGWSVPPRVDHSPGPGNVVTWAKLWTQVLSFDDASVLVSVSHNAGLPDFLCLVYFQ